MTIDFTKLESRDAIKLVELSPDRKTLLDENRRVYNGDHWRDGLGWVGPWPAVPEQATASQQRVIEFLRKTIRTEFISINATKEGVDRNESGTVGIEPRWGFTPTTIELPENATPGSPAAKAAEDKANARARDLETRVTGWWDKKSGHAICQDVARRLLYGIEPVAEVTGYLYIPSSFLVAEKQPDGSTKKVLRIRSLEDAFDKIHFEALDADQGRVVRDPETLAEIGVKPTKRGDQGEATAVEVTYLEPGDAPRPKTVVQTINGDSRPSISLDLGGRLTMITVRRQAFVTPQVRQSQKALNFAATMVKRNEETSGFLQDTLINADLPGQEIGEGAKKRFVADPMPRGPLALVNLKGYEIFDKDGNAIGLTTPSIDHRSPVDPTPTIKGKREHYADIMGEFKQRHVLIAGDAVASGESRIQARADHTAELRLTQAPIELFGRWLVETVALYANALWQLSRGDASANTILDGLRATFTCYLDAGPVDYNERAQNLAEMEAGVLSRQSTIEANGIVDVDAEIARINSEPSAGLDAETKRATIYGLWIKAGIGSAAAAKRAGLSPEEARALLEDQTDPPVPAGQ
jgi:hypothetical protein